MNKVYFLKGNKLVGFIFSGIKKSIKDYCIKPKYERPAKRRVIEKIPPMVYTLPESLKYIRGKAKDVNSKQMKEMEVQFEHIPKKMS